MTRSDRSTEPTTEVLSTVDALDTAPGPRGYESVRSAASAPAQRTAPERDDRTPLDPARARPPRRRRSWLTRLAGADQEILARAPADRPKFVSMGAVLIATAAVAAASAAFAMNMAVGLSPVPAVLVGLLWGLVILNLDRMLVVSMVTTAGLRRTLLTAIPRVVLAAVIGAIISMPLVLRIFDAEIQVERQRIQADDLSAAQAALNDDVRFAAIPGLAQEEARLIGVASGQSRGDIGADDEVRRLREAVAGKEREYAEVENALICERGGNAECGSGRPGAGPIYEELVRKEQRVRQERDRLRSDLAAAENAARQRVDTAAQQQVDVARADLTRVQEELAGLRAAKTRAEDDIAAAQRENNGLLIRLEALERLSSGSWMMLAAHGALFLLFLFIEVLPVLMKVLAAAGPPSLYDRLLQKREEDALEQADDESTERRAEQGERRRVRAAEEAGRVRIVEERANMAVALEQHRATASIEAGKRANLDLAAKQEELAQRAIAVWGEVAAARTDDELRQWYERHMEDVRRQADGQRRTGGPTESRRRQAVSYADFMTRKESSARARTRRSTPESPAPSDRVDADGIYRPPPATAEDGGSPDTVRDAGRTTEDRVQPGSTSVDERDSWNADDYPADVAPPPSVPPRADR